jgi:DnaJ-domain-containing protein 1
MDDSIEAGLFLVICAGVGYALVLAGREFLAGYRTVKAEYVSNAAPDEHADSAESRQGDRTGDAPQDYVNWQVRPWYDVLEVPAEATLADVKIAYRRKIALYHPDRVTGLAPELRSLAEMRSKELNVAYDTACRFKCG